MKKLILGFAALSFVSASAFADESKTTTHTATGGTVEETTDTTHNPLTGNDTTTDKVVTKDKHGKQVSKRVTKVKRDHKTGKLEKKSVKEESETDTESH